MAYLKHFKAFIVFSAILALLSRGTDRIGVKTPTDDDYREVSTGSAKDDKAALKRKKSAKLLNEYYAEQLETSGIRLVPGTDHRKDSKPTITSSKKCKANVYRTLSKLPESHSSQVESLTLFYTKDGRRGLAGGGNIVLRCLNVADSELASVLTHEIGHLVDANLLAGDDTSQKTGFYDFDEPVLADDPSLAFYKISWTSEADKKGAATEYDFVSLYAMTDPFEDFAETYTYYRLHGPEFLALTKTSPALKNKYEFMRDYVFGEQEFDVGAENVASLKVWTRNYDTTVLPFSFSKFISGNSSSVKVS